ncbi:DUF2971 domain-containing protein [Rhizobium ruizarguesonis]|uniref:DUF2971 domain-containing protein n=1 Tax=Rhizobium ruizarguesonis TaxID=2081791 RepID=UPI00103266B8|nr:DUF2971 domain-containing protein [Rhizobium ruizarguesonis]TAV05568.1 hypothetical protein ELI39_09980 [Rhizobium ruizarguesonis]
MAFLEYQPKSTLFHYCGAAGFEGILGSGSIWLSDLQHANDPKELQLAEVIDNLMGELVAEETIAPELKATYARLQNRLQLLKARFGMYSFSLSLREDQLPMWQEYTDRGRGYCIGFRASTFNHMPLRVQRVRYVGGGHLGPIHSAIEEIASPFVGHEGDFVREVEPVTRLLTLITSVKDDTWAHEDEVRLIFSSMVKPADFDGQSMIPVGLLRDGTGVYPEDPLTRERNGVRVPYFSKPFGRMWASNLWDPSRAISHVVVGPNNNRSIDEITQDLRAKGYRDFQVTRSRCAFRP